MGARISRRWFLGGGVAGALRPAERRPNIVLILADDLGSGDLSSYGCPDIRTPAIDSIGRQGVRFTRCYDNAPECTPTRCALLTGRYQQRVGGLECAIGLGNVGRYDEAVWLQERNELGLPASETSVAAMLRAGGYETACFGKWHLGYLEKFSPNRHGFQEYFGILGGAADYFSHTEPDGRPVLYHNQQPVSRPGYTTDLIGKSAVEWLGRRRSGPFFLYVPFSAPHSPFQGPEDESKSGTSAQRPDRPTYVRMVERMDQHVGAILEQLDRMKAAQNTLVIFLSDNGGPAGARNHPLRGGKSSLWEGGIRTPCLARWPGVVPQGTETAQVTVTMDLTATIVAAAGVRPPRGRKLDGIDLLPVWTGRRAPFPRTVFWRYKRLEARRKAVLDGELKYVIDNGREELHDLSEDPEEKRDLLAQRPEAAARMREKLEAWEREVAPPRLREFRPG